VPTHTRRPSEVETAKELRREVDRRCLTWAGNDGDRKCEGNTARGVRGGVERREGVIESEWRSRGDVGTSLEVKWR